MALPFETPTLAAINATIAKAIGRTFRVRSMRPAPGGCIHRSFVVSEGAQRFFVKVNTASLGPTLEAEADGLNALRDASVRAPEPIGYGIAGTQAYLVLEYIAMREPREGDHIGLAVMLADLHDTTGDRFGWPQPNFIGRTPQANPWHDSWIDFWQEARLAPQLELAAQNGHVGGFQQLGERVLDAVPSLLANHAPVPSLLHGDLWKGNAGFLANGSPVLFDPATYYGDRECDIAMTELFGGFPRVFYDTYHERWPLEDGYPERRDLYNLYHVLNHLNLFGGEYREQAETLMRRLLAAVA